MTEWGSYLVQHVTALRVGADAPLWLLLLLVPTLLAVLARGRGASARAWYARHVALAALAAALAGVHLRIKLPDDRLTIVAAVDRSASIGVSGRRWQGRYLDELASTLAPRDRLEVVVFGGRVRWLGSERRLLDERTVLDEQSTDIAAALDLARIAGGAGQRRIVLLSDGRESKPAALSRTASLRREGIPVFAAIPPRDAVADVVVDKLLVPAQVPSESVFPIRVVANNTAAERPAELELRVDGVNIGRESIRLAQGRSTVELPYRLTRPGRHTIAVAIAASGDPTGENDRLEAQVRVSGPLPVLLGGPLAQPALGIALEREGAAIVRPKGPITDADLERVSAVVLEDATAAELSPGEGVILERFVRERGGAVVIAGGAATFGDRALRDTAIGRLSPVSFEPDRPRRPERPPLGLFLVLDRSNSMGYHFQHSAERSVAESKLVYAQRAALAVLAQLKPNDAIGVIAFDGEPHEISPLSPVKEVRAALTEAIARLQPDGGTDFYEALASAADQLGPARVANRHAILLTDGDTNRGGSHEDLIARLKVAAVSVTTIRIGEDRANLGLLSRIAQETGGQFHHVESADALPELMLRDTGRALAELADSIESYEVHVARPLELLSGIDPESLPAVTGYAYTQAKPGATVIAEVETQARRDPLVGAWQYGLGRVVSFTASPGGDAAGWIGWDSFGKFWMQAVRWAVRDLPVHGTDSLDGESEFGSAYASGEYAVTEPDEGLLRRLAEATGGGFEVPIRSIADRQPGEKFERLGLDAVWAVLASLAILAGAYWRRKADE